MLKKYLKLSTEIANLFSHDEKIKVGAIILDRDNFDMLSVGYNRFFLDKMVHAEEVAIENAKKYNIPLKDNIIVVTQFPCKDCAILIIKSELSRVVTFHREVRGRWWDDEPSKKLFDKYNIGVEIYGT